MREREEQPAASGEAGGEAAGLDRLGELEALLALGRRAPGSDAERRAALHLKGRLEALGRTAELDSFSIYPAWPLAYALLAAAGVGASVLAVYSPAAGAALALAAILLTVLDAGLLLPTVRRLLGRRASQNVVSWGGEGKPGALVLLAHVDAGRGGVAQSDRVARLRATIAAATRRPLGGLQLILWAQLAVLACAVLRVAGIEGTPLTVIQLAPTLVLIVAVALLIDIALAGTRAGENDNASGCVLALRLAERASPVHFDIHVLFTGARKAGCAGMRDFLSRHRDRLAQDRTVLMNLDAVGSGGVRYTTSHAQLVELADQIVEDGFDAMRLRARTTSDGAAAAGAGFAAITVTCRDRLDYASGRVGELALDQAETFCAELIERLDAEIGPDLSQPR